MASSAPVLDATGLGLSGLQKENHLENPSDATAAKIAKTVPTILERQKKAEVQLKQAWQETTREIFKLSLDHNPLFALALFLSILSLICAAVPIAITLAGGPELILAIIITLAIAGFWILVALITAGLTKLCLTTPSEEEFFRYEYITYHPLTFQGVLTEKDQNVCQELLQQKQRELENLQKTQNENLKSDIKKKLEDLPTEIKNLNWLLQNQLSTFQAAL